MKVSLKKSQVVAILLGAASIAGMMLARAQETATLSTASIVPRSPANLPAIESYSDAQLTQLINTLAATPLIYPSNYVANGNMSGTFWSLAHPNWPPLPGSFGTPFWNLTPSYSASSMSYSTMSSDSMESGGSFLLLDDVDFPPSPGGGDGGTNVYIPSFQPMDLPTTNDLWLQIVSTTNTGTSITANLIIHPPWNMTDGVWDIFAITDLTSNTWQWVYRSAPGQTNVTIAGLAYPNEFFRAASTNDTDGDLLSDAYEKWVSHTDPDVFNIVSSDGAGTPDAWYLEHGINPLASGVASQDPDLDALVNSQEYLYGTDPTTSEGFAIWISTPNGTTSIP